MTAVFGSVTSLKSGEVGGVTAVFGSVTSLKSREGGVLLQCLAL